MQKVWSLTARACAGFLCLLAGLAVAGGMAYGQFGAGGAGSMGGIGGGDIPGSIQGNAGIQPWLALNGSYTHNLATNVPTAVPSATRDYFGYGGSGGVNGGKAWEKDSLAGMYIGSYQNYNGSNASDGFSSVGALSYSHRFSPRVGISLSEFGGSSIGGYGYGSSWGAYGGYGLTGLSDIRDISTSGAGGLNDPAQNGIVDNEIFRTRVNFLGSNATLVYQPTLRWSYAFTGGASFSRRQDIRLNDSNAYNAGAMAGYRISRRTQVNMMYSYMRFGYPGLFSGNNAHFGGVGISHQISARTKVSAYGGATYFNADYVGSVAIDPGLAALLGQSSVLQLKKMSAIRAAGGANISYSRNRAGFGLSYDRGLTPGNGALLAAWQDSVTANTSYFAHPRVSFGAAVGAYRAAGIIQEGSTTKTLNMTGSVTIRVVQGMHFSMSGGYRQTYFPTQPNLKDLFAYVGIGWSPERAAFRF